jgi:hypothetical protein
VNDTNQNNDITVEMMPNPLKIGKYRNKKCLCGSGIKVKFCCGVMKDVPVNLGKMHQCTLNRDIAGATHFSKLWAQDLNNAKKLIEEQKCKQDS